LTDRYVILQMKRTMYIQVNMPIDRFGVHVLSHLLLWHILIRAQELAWVFVS